MTETNLGFKWHLLKNGKMLYHGGIASIFLFPVFLKILHSLFEGISIITLAVSALLFYVVVAIIIYVSSDLVNLYKVVEGLLAPFVVEDISLIHTVITIKDDRARMYTIKFFNPSDHDSDSEYYEAWTPLRRSLPQNGSLPSWSTLTKELPWFAKLTKKDGNLVLLSTLSKKTAHSQMNQRLNALRKLAHDIDLWGYGEIDL